MRDKQIEEMEKIIQPFIDYCWAKDWFPNGGEIAKVVYDKGYRKASDVVREIADFIWDKDIPDTLLPINGRYLSKQDFIAELKKKYESEGEG